MTTFPQGQQLEEKQLEERLKSLQIDERNIARVIADTISKAETDILRAMKERTTLRPEEAKNWGLVHEIRRELFPSGADVILIQ